MNYQKVEGILYSHYRKKKRLQSLQSREIRIYNRIDRLRKDIKECNIDLENTMQAIDYSKDNIQSGSVTSSIEKELERAVDKILKELEYNIKDKYKTKSKINRLEKQIENIDIILKELTDEELQIIELRYGECIKSYRRMESIIPMGKSTIERKHKEVIHYLIERLD